MKMPSRSTLCALAVALIATASGRSSAQVGQQLGQIRYNSGQNVVPVFEGWEQNADGTFNLVFGYMNRNYLEEVELPVSPSNSFSPGPADQGQPTHFYPRRQQFMFRVKVPADFGKKELVWTLTRKGQTEKAYGTLLAEEELSANVISRNRGGLEGDSVVAKPNRPPTISIDGPLARTVSVGKPVTLAVLASDDGVPALPPPPATPPPARGPGLNPAAAAVPRENPNSQAIVKAGRQGLAVTWTHWRGPGKLLFDPMTMVVKDGKATTSVVFNEPGTYVVRVYADDSTYTAPADLTISVTAATTGTP